MLTYWEFKNQNVFVHTSWIIIISTLSFATILFSGILFALRIKAKYTYREIEDIVIYDASQKQTLDFDSPAILEVYFNELRNYENQPFYYKKVVADERKPHSSSVFTIN